MIRCLSWDYPILFGLIGLGVGILMGRSMYKEYLKLKKGG